MKIRDGDFNVITRRVDAASDSRIAIGAGENSKWLARDHSAKETKRRCEFPKDLGRGARAICDPHLAIRSKRSSQLPLMAGSRRDRRDERSLLAADRF